METLIMRFLSISVSLDTKGSNFPGCYWSITHIPAKHNGDNAHLPIPPTRSAVMAIQPLNVYQIDLPEDIDSADNESGELEMKRVGYVGNTNRRAIPIILVRYATALPGFGSSKVCAMMFIYLRNFRLDPSLSQAVKALIDHCGILAGSQTPDASYVTPTQLSLLTRLLYVLVIFMDFVVHISAENPTAVDWLHPRSRNINPRSPNTSGEKPPFHSLAPCTAHLLKSPTRSRLGENDVWLALSVAKKIPSSFIAVHALVIYFLFLGLSALI